MRSDEEKLEDEHDYTDNDRDDDAGI